MAPCRRGYPRSVLSAPAVRERTVTVLRTVLPAIPGSVAAGRRYACDVLVSRNVEPLVVETVELLTSEVMTYALRTARGTRQELRIELAADQVCVQVSDSLVLTARRRMLAGPQGRSRTVIDTLADNWGLVVEPHGRHMWFTVVR